MTHVNCPRCLARVEVSDPDAHYPAKGRERNWITTVQWIAAVALVATAIIASCYLWVSVQPPGSAARGVDWTIVPHKGLLISLITCWTFWVVAPPSWFAFEYYYLFNRRASAERFNEFKYGQEITTKAWYTIVIVLGAILYKSFK